MNKSQTASTSDALLSAISAIRRIASASPPLWPLAMRDTAVVAKDSRRFARLHAGFAGLFAFVAAGLIATTISLVYAQAPADTCKRRRRNSDRIDRSTKLDAAGECQRFFAGGA